MGFRIFILCLKQIVQNWTIAVRLSWFWVLVVLVVLFLQTLTLTQVAIDGVDLHNSSALLSIFSLALINLVAFVILFVGTASIAVGWHRYILRNKMPPKFHLIHFGWPIGAYILMIIQIAIILILIFIPFAFFVLPIIHSIIGTSNFGTSIPLSTLVLLQCISMIMSILFTWISLRFGLVLPAIAVGEEVRLRQSRLLTRRIKFDLVVTAALIILLQSIPAAIELVISTSISSPFPGFDLAVLLINGLFTWLCLFVGIGVLTVIYGQLHEKRAM